HAGGGGRRAAVLGGGPGRAVLWAPGNDPAVVGTPVGAVPPPPPLPLAAQIARVERIFVEGGPVGLRPAGGEAERSPLIGDEDTAATAERAFRILGGLAARAGDPATAARLSARAGALRPAPPHPLARARRSLGAAAGARAEGEAAARALPGRAEVWSLLGVLDARAGRCADAARHLARALALDPADRDANANLARMPLCYGKMPRSR